MVGHPTPAEDDPSGKRYAFEMGAAKTSGGQGGADVAKLEIFKFIAKRKHYPQEAKVTFHFTDYRNDFNEPFETFDLLISQYAGFVGQHCKPYLKIGGLLVTNNSHGDAGMAAIDDDYQLKAVFSGRNG